MAHCSTLIGQLLQLIPRHVFDHQVDSHAWQGPNPRKFTYWSHLGAMLFGQWSARKSLRDLLFSLNRQARKFYHLGFAAVPRSILADQIIHVSSPQGQACYPDLLRRIHYQDPETGKKYVFLTNRLDLPALEVEEIYRRRWQIELFFKWIKPNLKIKAFYATSKNAVPIQIWTALIAYLLPLWLKFKSTTGWGLLQLTRLAQTMLLERLDLWALLCPPPPDNRQPLLFNQRAGQQ
jgi:hypothetical protein